MFVKNVVLFFFGFLQIKAKYCEPESHRKWHKETNVYWPPQKKTHTHTHGPTQFNYVIVCFRDKSIRVTVDKERGRALNINPTIKGLFT